MVAAVGIEPQYSGWIKTISANRYTTQLLFKSGAT